MDTADSSAVRAALTNQGKLIGQQAEQLGCLQLGMADITSRTERQMASFSEQMSQLAQQIQQLLPVCPSHNPEPAAALSTPTPPPSGFAFLTPPERFSGDSGDCRPFLTQCGLHRRSSQPASPS
ncbi:uncharacterized protein AKAME5_001982600 [Lates japonicus]|uniref:Uncharacterized protein n=1 Tax=Lates japonicus TaxID=270547 RepID=A0AAD3NA23_LATJO|nr:uncharacterized protein AKAME5_001982600 [Lates japonicus]